MTFRAMRRLALTLAAGLAALAATGAAQAGFTVTLNTVAPEGASYRYSYNASIASGDVIDAGNFFRIYDVYGLVPGSVTLPAGWSVSTDLTNPTPPPNVLLTEGDQADVPNLTFTYNGSTPITGPQSIPGFTLLSQYPLIGTFKNFVGQATQAGGATGGSPVDSVGLVRVPGTVPEPSSLVSAAVGAGLALLALRKSRRR